MKSNNISVASRLRHVAYFVRVLDATLYLPEMKDLLVYYDFFDEDFKQQVIKTKTLMHEEIKHLNHFIDELHKDIMVTRKQIGLLMDDIHKLKTVRKQPGPSGCTLWDIKLSSDITDDGNTAFMVLEEV
ncbi:unnamed protein product [Strongylus vulgaris]|uniref:Uncharacterized protein n=1 Tax=Strongylus vulgaris TaxID=40348 RepID=A0A3P7IRH9_STRVU|nr:unnamed protein product [Strongylus vulgaris]